MLQALLVIACVYVFVFARRRFDTKKLRRQVKLLFDCVDNKLAKFRVVFHDGAF